MQQLKNLEQKMSSKIANLEKDQRKQIEKTKKLSKINNSLENKNKILKQKNRNLRKSNSQILKISEKLKSEKESEQQILERSFETMGIALKNFLVQRMDDQAVLMRNQITMKLKEEFEVKLLEQETAHFRKISHLEK